jgi:hypothetical protein
MTTLFHDIYTNSTSYNQCGQRKYTVMVDGLLYGIVLATKSYRYDTFALNKAELEDGLAAKRAGRLARVFVVAVTTHNGGKYDPQYVGEIDAEKLERSLTGVQARYGQFGEFYTIDNYTFGDAAF